MVEHLQDLSRLGSWSGACVQYLPQEQWYAQANRPRLKGPSSYTLAMSFAVVLASILTEVFKRPL